MARRLIPSPMFRLLKCKSLASPSSSSPFAAAISCRCYISEMRRSAFKENLLRILRTEIAYEVESRPPSTPDPSFQSFSVDDRPGEQWIHLRRSHGQEEIKIKATMFDGAAPSSRSAESEEVLDPNDARLHISLIVEVSKGEASEFALQFACSAWPDDLEVEKVYPVRRGHPTYRPYTGPDLKELDEEMQNSVAEYLEDRGVNDDLARFLHAYMANKDRTELLRWLRNIETYIKK